MRLPAIRNDLRKFARWFASIKIARELTLGIWPDTWFCTPTRCRAVISNDFWERPKRPIYGVIGLSLVVLKDGNRALQRAGDVNKAAVRMDGEAHWTEDSLARLQMLDRSSRTQAPGGGVSIKARDAA